MLKVLGLTSSLSVFISLISVSSLALASKVNWVEFTPSQSGDRVFLDVNSIRKKKGTREVTYKVRHTYSKATSNGVVRSNAVYTAYCDVNGQRLKEFTAYNISNRIVQSTKNSQEPLEQVTVGSLNYSAFKYACSR
ncbi:MAG: hypothetical protein U7123_03875 [Potamolinea sp.]